MNQHPVGVALVGGVHQRAVGIGRADAGGPGSVRQDGRSVVFGFLLLRESDGCLAVLGPGADDADHQCVQQRSLDFVHYLGGQRIEFQCRREPAQAPA